ncbi:translesion error-prone DNA polymerase V autoproteolytic subunit [Arthrobacter ginkgonis]|uniref:Translesion error-prone DNA polymerase V autoproteolytic subunit n=2 Tax=Arthrobacter ginkgonis TaxID=1630594 RepID=A0ABP7C5F1_9MICC
MFYGGGMIFHADPPAGPAGPASGGGGPARNEARGFPSPAQDYFHGGIDLNRHLIRDRTCTFLMRVEGNAMAAAGIADGDEIIVDRSLTPRDGSVVVAVHDGELTVRRLRSTPRGVSLVAEGGASQADEPAVEVAELAELEVWGVVTRCLHHV